MMVFWQAIQSFAISFWSVLCEAAPWLILGLVVAGLTKMFVPTSGLVRWLGGGGPGPVLRAAVIGTPLPLCSCGVLPTAVGLSRQGASPGATVSFLIATPSNGADSIAISYALLGPFLMVARLLAALGAALLAGLLAAWWAAAGKPAAVSDAKAASCCGPSPAQAAPAAAGGCCGTAPQPEAAGGCEPMREVPADSGGGCCETSGAGRAEPAPSGGSSKSKRLVDALRFAFVDIYDDIKYWLLIGLLAAALIHSVVEPDALARWGAGWTGMLLMLVVGLPMYICATASVPVAASLLAAGVGPGAVIVFLLAGPATNVGTVMAIRQELGTGALLGYLAGVCAAALGGGLAAEALAASMELDVRAQVEDVHRMLPLWFESAAAVVLIVCAIPPLRASLGRLFGR